MLICHVYIVFGEVPVQIICSNFSQVFFLLLNFKSSLCILDKFFIECVFSNFVSSLLLLSFKSKSFLILMKSSLLFLSWKNCVSFT